MQVLETSIKAKNDKERREKTKKKMMIAGTGCPSTKETIELTKAAADLVCFHLYLPFLFLSFASIFSRLFPISKKISMSLNKYFRDMTQQWLLHRITIPQGLLPLY